MNMKKVTAIILAGGIGSRMQADVTKQNILIMGKSVLERTVRAFSESRLITDLVIVARREELAVVSELVQSMSFDNLDNVLVTEGGATRAHSAKNGFSAVKWHSDFIAIHDSARCLITSQMIDKVVLSAFENGAATAACAVTDTVKVVDSSRTVVSTIPRENVYRAQTPQVFAYDVYKKALLAIGDNIGSVTDDNMLVEAIGVKIFCVDLGQSNIKITTRDDIALAEFIIRQRGESDV